MNSEYNDIYLNDILILNAVLTKIYLLTGKSFNQNLDSTLILFFVTEKLNVYRNFNIRSIFLYFLLFLWLEELQIYYVND